MSDTLIVPSRFRGPPNSGNGGYVAGAVAERFPLRPGAPEDTAVEVTLRAPIPLDTPMRVECSDESHLRVLLGEQLIAEAAPARLAADVPAPPTFAAALAARAHSPALAHGLNPLIPGGTGFHPVCVCCGADVPEGEGLRVFAAPVPGFDGVAAAWRPHPAFADAEGLLPERMIWTALDCPGQFAYFAAGIRTGLLGRMTARVLRPVPVDADYVVIGWRQEIERRKHFAGTALFDADGVLCAYSRQTWIGRMD
ncbi:MAG TPA: hypothetical protein VF210_05435 [Pseudomonadales bacterium]